MSGMVRTIKRQMLRDAIQESVTLGKMACPKCGAKLVRRNIISTTVRCPNCNWRGKIGMKRRVIK